MKGNKRRKPPHLVVLGFRFALVRPTDGSYLLPCFLTIEKTARVHIRFYYQDEKKRMELMKKKRSLKMPRQVPRSLILYLITSHFVFVFVLSLPLS